VTAILETRDLTRRFGSLVAVDAVNLAISPGEIHAVIGPNGAGKTTLFNLITGKLPPSDGTIRFEDRDITDEIAYQIVRRGIGRSFQITNIFPRLTAFENVFIAALAQAGRTRSMLSAMGSFAEEAEAARAVLARVELAGKADLPTAMLSHGERRNLELGLTLALKPKLILLDEPTAGMSVEETAHTVDLIRRISEDTTVLFTEHDMSIVFSIAHVITVLHQGAVIAQGPPAEVRSNREVQSAYLGEEV
jgi:branched-chain amino acid transport system ATP-binding protein